LYSGAASPGVQEAGQRAGLANDRVSPTSGAIAFAVAKISAWRKNSTMDMEKIKPKKEAAKKSTDRLFQVIIDTPKGSRNKYKYDEEQKLFKLGGVLTAGAVFPFDFGFLPRTVGEDGDALDVLVLMDEPAFVGCLVEARIIGVIEAEQTEEGKKPFRNDRLLAVASESHSYENVSTLSQLNENLVTEIEHFFVSYNQAKGKEFKPLRRSGARRAKELIETGIENFSSKSR
jgi:inorganic pyrophosphatase